MTLLCLATFFSWSAASSYLKDACALVMVWLVFYAAYVFLVAVHETGHLVAGAACGFRTKEFRVGCLRWRGGWGFDWRGINVLSGWVNMQLTRPDDALRLRRLLFVTAGPLANLVCAALLYPIAVHQSTSGGMAKYLFLGNILFAVVNLIPMKARKLKSDGLQILSTLFDQAGFEALRFHIRCQEAAPTLQELRDKDDWLGVKQLAEQLLSLSAEVRAEEKVVKSLDTVLRFADSRLAGATIAEGK
jgi:hypothetical protein